MNGAAQLITVFGAPYSVYTRIVRLTLEEKGLRYDLSEVDIFGKDIASSDHRARHPFMRIPAITIGGQTLFEAGAIARYLDETFDGPSLQPKDAFARARMNQVISIMDSYGFRSMVWGVFVERIRKTSRGETADEAIVRAGLETSETILRTLPDWQQTSVWLTGEQPTLADIWAFPMLTLLDLTDEGRRTIGQAPSVRRWLDMFAARPSAIATRFPIEADYAR